MEDVLLNADNAPRCNVHDLNMNVIIFKVNLKVIDGWNVDALLFCLDLNNNNNHAYLEEYYALCHVLFTVKMAVGDLHNATYD